MPKDTYYFSHDYNARNDPKILAMRSKYGPLGYGLFWMTIEILREQPEYKYPMSGSYWCGTLAMQMQCECSEIESFINDCIEEFGLFESDGKFFWSNSLLNRMALREQKSEKARKAAEVRWSNTKDSSSSNASAMQTHSNSNAIAMQGKERKGKENIKDIDHFFEDLWSHYPEKKGKTKVSKKSKDKLYTIGLEKSISAITRYVKEVERKRQNGFPQLNFMHGSTFFNGGYEDYLEEELNSTTHEKDTRLGVIDETVYDEKAIRMNQEKKRRWKQERETGVILSEPY